MKGKKLQTEERHKGLQHQGTARPAERSTGRHSPRRVLHSSAERKGLTCPGAEACTADAGQSSHPPFLPSLPWGHTHVWKAEACPQRARGGQLQAQKAQCSSLGGTAVQAARLGHPAALAQLPWCQGFARCHTAGTGAQSPIRHTEGKGVGSVLRAALGDRRAGPLWDIF